MRAITIRDHIVSRPRHARSGEGGQIIVIAALAMIAIIAGVSLIVEGGNAYAHQRVAQNGADALANTGATVLAERLGGTSKTDTDVATAMDGSASDNHIDTYDAYYTNVNGDLLNATGTVVGSTSAAAAVGDGAIPPTTQGVHVFGSQTFGTTFAGALGINQFTASADATARTGALTGGKVLPVVFPVSQANCDGSGNLVENPDEVWRMSNPGDPPVGQEWNVPLCKTGGGSFMVLDLDPDKTCAQEVTNPPRVQYNDFPVEIPTDNGNECLKQIAQAVAAADMQGSVVMIPICDEDCSTAHGSSATYHVTRFTAFYLDYVAYQNSGTNAMCALTTSPTYGTSIMNITGGNGSSSCIAGWFVRYVTKGPVGSGTISHGEAIGIQLIK